MFLYPHSHIYPPFISRPDLKDEPYGREKLTNFTLLPADIIITLA
jgi:hypothetical protein